MARKQASLDVEQVRQAAAGRWREILEHVAGVAPDLLDGDHHPCPRCGGDDRFRFIDEAAGAVLCNQCFSEKNGDGFAAISWARGIKFPEAVKLVAAHCGVAPASKSLDPAKDLDWMPWSTDLAALFLMHKQGITEEALLATGARMARYKNTYTVIAWPIIGSNLKTSEPVGWVIANFNGSLLPVWNKDGIVTKSVKYKITPGSGPGLVGTWAIDRIKIPGMTEIAWKVEGISDLVALQGAIPQELRERHLVLTNACGSRETPRWPATVLSAVNSHILHDADAPGQEGAQKWTREIASQNPEGVKTRNVLLPYDVAENHGRDLRDYLSEGNTYTDLLALAERFAPLAVARNADGEIDYSKHTNPSLDRLMKKLQIEVLYEDETGAIRIFSAVTKKSSTIRQISRMRHEDLLQIAGAPAVVHVMSSERDAAESEDTWTMTDVRRAIALAAATRRGKSDERGIGVWQGLDNDGNETETVVLVGNTEGARWNGDKKLRKIAVPRADGLVLDFGAASSKDWFAFGELQRYLGESGELGWRQNVVSEAVNLFSRWRWRSEVAPTLVTGLAMATWVQTIWEWRPLIGITGESHSGKSFLFNLLGGDQQRRGLFGHLAYKPDQSTEAGIRQHVANTAVVVLLDELENSPDRQKILQTLRTSTRGGFISKGVPGGHQRGVNFQIRHIVWTAATEAGLTRQPDLNRWIQLDLLRARPEDAGKLVLPEPSELVMLGQKLLAISVRCVMEAKKIAAGLKATKVPGIDPRTIEVYSAPASMLAAAEGVGVDVARAILMSLLKNVDVVEQGQTDQDELLSDILTSQVFLDAKSGIKTVGQVIQSPADLASYAERLASEGIRLMDDMSLFVVPALVQRSLLKNTRWHGMRIDQIAMRLEGAIRAQVRIAGCRRRGVCIPRNHFEETAENVATDSENPQQRSAF